MYLIYFFLISIGLIWCSHADRSVPAFINTRSDTTPRRYCGPFQYFLCLPFNENARISRNAEYSLPSYLVPPPLQHINQRQVQSTGTLQRFPRLVLNSQTEPVNNFPINTPGFSGLRISTILDDIPALATSESQLAPVVAANNVDKSKYDKCSHPFHSWLCASKTRTRSGSGSFPDSIPTASPKGKALFSAPEAQLLTTPRPTTTTTNVRRGSVLFGEPIYTTTPMTTTSVKVTEYDKCNHPFHSWLCKPNATTTSKPFGKQLFPEPSNHRQGSELFGEPSSLITTTTTEKSVPRKVTTAYDKCNHPFHSWLCQKASRPRSKSISQPFPSNVVPQQSKHRSGSELFSDPIQTTTIRTTTMPTTQKTTTPYDKCSHPFHSWLCGNKQTSTALPRKSGKSLDSDPSHRRGSTLFSDPIITTATPVRKGSALDSVAASPSTIKPMTKSYEKCSHAFHAWLCRKAPNKPANTFRSGSVLFSEPSNAGKALDALPDTTPSTTTTTEKIIDCTNPINSQICPTKPPRRGGQLDAEPASGSGKSLSNTKPDWDKTDPCKHAFHSWLCKVYPIKISIPKNIPNPRQQASFRKSIVNTTPEPPPPTTTVTTTTKRRFGSTLFGEPVTTTSTTPIPTTTTARRKGTFIAPDSRNTNKKGKAINSEPEKSVKSYDKCYHPFHSWLCNYYLTETKVRLPFGSDRFLVGKRNIPNISNLPLENDGSNKISQINTNRRPVETSTTSNFRVIRNSSTSKRLSRNIDHTTNKEEGIIKQQTTLITSDTKANSKRFGAVGYNDSQIRSHLLPFSRNPGYLLFIKREKSTSSSKPSPASSVFIMRYPGTAGT